MTDPRTSARLRHMLVAAREAISIIKEKSRDDLDKDRLLNLTLVRLLEIIEEAANQIPCKFKGTQPFNGIYGAKLLKKGLRPLEVYGNPTNSVIPEDCNWESKHLSFRCEKSFL